MACEKCGVLNPQGKSFCSNCGAFLMWDKAVEPGRRGRSAVAGDEGALGRPGGSGDATAELSTLPVTAPNGTDPGRAHDASVASVRGPRDDVVCPSCGGVNAATQAFCGSCGAPLTAATTGETPGATPGATGATTGRRRAPRRTRSWGLRWLAVAAVVAALVLAAVLLRSQLGEVASAALDRLLGSTAADPPPRLSASSSATGHGATRLHDGKPTTYWLPTPSGRRGAAVTATFDHPVRLVSIGITPGQSDDAKVFRAHARPSEVKLTLTLADGTKQSSTAPVADSPGEQRLEVGASDVTAVRLAVAGVVAGKQARRPAIAELTYYVRG